MVKRYTGDPCNCDSICAMVKMLKEFISKYYEKEVNFIDLNTRTDKYTFCLLNSYLHYDIIDDVRERCNRSISNADSYYKNSYMFSKFFDAIKIDEKIKDMVLDLINELKDNPMYDREFFKTINEI